MIQPQKNLYTKLQALKPRILYLICGGREHGKIMEAFRGKEVVTVSDTFKDTDVVIEDAKPRLDMERAALSLRMTHNIEENDDNISHAIQRFESISSSLFEKSGMLTVENAPKWAPNWCQ